MKDFRSFWREHWLKAVNGEHRHFTDEWLHFYADELLLYCPERPVRALELGCGSGQLYDFLKDRFSSYTGVDFSFPLLLKFKSNWKGTYLICADISCLPLSNVKYEFIFSNAICQYMDQDMLQSNLDCVYPLLDHNGLYLIGNIPDIQLQLFYYAQALRGDLNISWQSLIRCLIDSLMRKTDVIGKWYS